MFIPYSNSADDNESIRELYRLLKNAGLVFPDTGEELLELLAHAEKNSNPIPLELDNPALILNNGPMRLEGALNASRDEALEENMAQAARQGADLSEKVKEKMKKDRDECEKQGSDDHTE